MLNCGVWYNQVKMDVNFEHAFNETLQLIGPTLNNLIKSGMIVAWISLPFRGDVKLDGDPNQFGWESFQSRDELAKSVLSNYGVIFINPNEAIKDHYNVDPKIFKNGGIHYCEPSIYSIPNHINNILMHTIAKSLIK